MEDNTVNNEVDVNVEQVESTTETTKISVEDWRGGISEEIRDDELLKDVGSIEDLAKGYVHAQRRMGGMVRIPTEDASKEQLDEFYGRLEKIPGVLRVNEEDLSSTYNKLGRPESADGYTIPEGMEGDEALGKFRELAHKAGLTADQYNAMLEFEKGRAAGHEQALEQGRVQAEATLKEMWGSDYDNRLKGAKATIATFSEQYPEAVQELINGPAGNNPVLLDILSKLGSVLQEQGHPSLEGTVNYGTTPQEALDKIDEILGNPAHPYHDRSNPAHNGAVEKVRTLYQQAYPDA